LGMAVPTTMLSSIASIIASMIPGNTIRRFGFATDGSGMVDTGEAPSIRFDQLLDQVSLLADRLANLLAVR
jgi:hypothetical protein